MDDRLEIERLIYAYADRMDGGDFERFAALFAAGEWKLAGDGGFALRGADAVRTWLDANIVLYDGVTRTSHVTSNVVISVEGGAEVAHARSYVVVFQEALPAVPLQAIYTGRNEDVFVKRDGAWQFEKRTIFTVGLGDNTAHVRA